MKKETRADKEKKPLSDDLKERIIAVKKLLPNSGITSLIAYKHPELNTIKKRSLVSNVLQLRITDEDITVKLEKLAETLNTEA